MKNTFVKVLSFLMALTMIVGTFGVMTISAAGCAHENATEGDFVAPKCDAVGYTWYTCNDCGASFKDDFVPATGKHVPTPYFGEGESAQATCTAPAYVAGTKCADCGDVITPSKVKEGSEPLRHVFGDGTFVDRTYCTENTYVEYRCTRCGLSAEKCKEKDAAGDFAPKGKTYDNFAAKVVSTGAAGHDWNEYVVVSAPANGCASTTVARSCKLCPKTETVVTAHSHNYVAHDYRNERNYCGEFLYWKECTKCHDVIDQIANPGNGTNHKLVAIDRIPATDKQIPGTTTYYTEEQVLAFKQFNAAHNEKFKLHVDLSETATCQQGGWQVYICQLCGEFSLSTYGVQDHKYNESAYILNNDTTQGLEDADLGGVANHATGDKDKACTTAVAIVRKCKWYDACKEVEIVSVITPAVQHNYTVDADRNGRPDGINVTAPTCTTNGYTTYTCQNANCNVEYVQDYTGALGHAMSGYYYCNAAGDTEVAANALDCTNGIYKRTKCTREGCGYKTDVEVVLAPAADHVLSTSKTGEVAATCQKGAYKYFVCTNSDLCAHVSAEIEGTVGTTLNPNNHDLTNAVELTAKAVAATCTAAGTKTYACKCGKDVVKTEGRALGHAYGTDTNPNRTWVGPDDVSGTEDDVDLSAVPATCLKTGLTAGVVCGRCGNVKTPQTKTAINPNNHVSVDGVAQTGTPLETHAATCLKPAYQVIRYDGCCDAKVEKKTNGNVLGSCATVYVDNQAPTCTEVGYHAHTKCTVCGKITAPDFSNTDVCGRYHTAEQHAVLANSTVWTAADVTIPALGHLFTTQIPRREAQCVVTEWNADGTAKTYTSQNGYTAHQMCSRTGCGVENDYTILRAHARDVKAYAASNPTCTAPGFVAGTYCKTCVNIVGSSDYNRAHDTAGHSVDKLDHAYGADVTDTSKYIFVNVSTSTGAYTVTGTNTVSGITINKVVDCKEAAYVLRLCTRANCGEINMVPGSYVAANADHEWNFAATTHPVQTEKGTGLTSDNWTYACWGSSYTSKDCARCEQISNAVYANDQIKHYYYVAGVLTEIDTSCNAIAKYDAVRCELCGLEVIAKNDALDAYRADGYIGANHNYVTNSVAATCTVTGYTTTYCTVCRVEKGAPVTTPPFNPSLNPYVDGVLSDTIVKALVKLVPATETATGSVDYFCKKCDGRHTYVIPAKGVTVKDYDVSVVPSVDAVASGNTITFVVKVKANKDLTFNSLRLNLNNVNNLFSIVDAELNYSFDSNMYVDVAGSYINIYTEHDSEGKPVNLTIAAGEFVDFVTLTVVANEYANGTTGELQATFSDVKYYKADGKIASSTFTVGSQTKNKVAVYGVGELNGDGIIAGVSDIQKLIALYNAGSEDAIADINRDGTVNGKDIVALRAYSVSAKKAIDYITMIGVDLDEAIAAAATPNMDNNYVVDVNDEILFANAIKNKLATMTAEQYFAKNYASIDDCILALTIEILPSVN